MDINPTTDEAFSHVEQHSGLICSLQYVTGMQSSAKYGFTIRTPPPQPMIAVGYGPVPAIAIEEAWKAFVRAVKRAR